MATKIGFDAKLAGTGVDWATVGKDVSETLIQQEQQREKNRVAMDKAVADEIKTLAGTELGKDAQANQWIMNGVGAISGSSLMDQRLLKNGLLNSKDFSRNLANRTQGTELVFQAYNTYNKDYDEIMEKINSGDLSEKTLQARAQVESMFDFANTDIFINPTDSEVNVSKKVLKDGVMVMSDNPDDFMNASELMQGATAQYAKFQANDEAKALADAVGQRVLRDIGGNTVTEAYLKIDSLSVAERKKLDEARKLQIQSVLTDDKAGSFLVDTLNKTLEPGKGPYSFTKNKDEAARDEYKILMNQDGSNDFTTDNGKKQMELAVEKFDVMLEGFLPAKRTAPLPEKVNPRVPSYSESKDIKLAKQQGEAMAKTWYGNVEQVEEGINFIKSLTGNEDIVGYDIQEDQIILEKIDTKGQTGRKGRRYKLPPIPRGDDFEAYITSIASELGAKGSDLDAVVKAAMKSLPKDSEGNPLKRNIDFGKDEKGVKKSGYKYEISKQKGLTSKFTDYVSGKINISDKPDDDITAQNLQSSLEALGTGIEVTSTGIINEVIKIAITPKISREFNLADTTVREDINAFLRNNIDQFEESLKVSEDKIDEFLNEQENNPGPQPGDGASKPKGYNF